VAARGARAAAGSTKAYRRVDGGPPKAILTKKPWFSVFTRALEDLGWKEGANIRIDRRWAASDVAGLRTQASELARLGLDSADGRAA
jgi:hypothetical protein